MSRLNFCKSHFQLTCPRVIHLPTTVAGFSSNFSHEINKLGLRSFVWTYSQNYLNYSCDYVVFSNSRNTIFREIRRLLALRYVFLFDLVVFNFGSTLFTPLNCNNLSSRHFFKNIYFRCLHLYLSFFQRVELILLKLLRKKIIVVYLGDDARQKDYSLSNFEECIARHVSDGYYPKGSDDIKRRQIALMNQYASFVYAVNPDLFHILPKRARFLPYIVPPVNLDSVFHLNQVNECFRFAHAPTNRQCKGTDEFIEVINSLQESGFNCNLSLIENYSHSEALQEYKKSNIMLDQLYAGWYGTLAVETMSLGIPTASFIRDSDLGFIPLDMSNELPIIKIYSYNLFNNLLQIMKLSSEELQKISSRSIKFVNKWHNSETIAIKLVNEWLV